MINELITLCRGVLTFDHATYVRHIESRDALKRGLLLLVIVALLTGLFTFLGDLISSFRSREADLAAVQSQIEQQMQINPAMRDPEFQKYLMGSLRESMAIAEEIMRMPLNIPFLPHWLGRILQAFGEWISTPFAWLGAWAWYALWVMLFAKLLGGRATLERMLAATLLFVIPHALYVLGDLIGLLSAIPTIGACFGCVSGLIGLVAWGWGVAIYIKATATVNELSIEKAALATVLPAVIIALLALVIGITFAILIAIAGAG